ncbi:hypothetical protein L7F22_068545 [Adiantum nelumboides]|nr:hypothetical protein [Adiantum nelumboides]
MSSATSLPCPALSENGAYGNSAARMSVSSRNATAIMNTTTCTPCTRISSSKIVSLDFASAHAASCHSRLICPHRQQLARKHIVSGNVPTPAYSTNQLLRVQLPVPVDCIFSVRLQPEYESIVEESDRWTLRLLDLASPVLQDQEAVRVAYLHSLYPLLPAASFSSPCVSRHRLLMSVRLSNWLFILDDTIDEADAQTAAELVKGFVTVLTSPRSAVSVRYSTSHARIQQFMEVLRLEVWEEIRREMSADLERRFVAECVRSIEAMKEMWGVRRRTAAAWSSGAVAAIELPDPDGSTPIGKLVQEMIRAAGKQALCVNELFSFGREFVKMDVHSLAGALLLQRQRRPAGGDSGQLASMIGADEMQDVLREIWGIIQVEEGKCASLLQQIRRLAAGREGLLNVMYAEALCHFVAGHLFWTTVT